MIGKGKKDGDKSKRFPPASPFGNKKSPTGNLKKGLPEKKASNLDKFKRTNKADRGTGPLNANSNMDLTTPKKVRRDFTETSYDDGITVVKYKEPQKIGNLINDAKQRVGGVDTKFFSKGWVIGEEIAKISPDGLTVTYYPSEVADLVHELIGYPTNED